jgi:hypothetical protein
MRAALPLTLFEVQACVCQETASPTRLVADAPIACSSIGRREGCLCPLGGFLVSP